MCVCVWVRVCVTVRDYVYQYVCVRWRDLSVDACVSACCVELTTGTWLYLCLCACVCMYVGVCVCACVSLSVYRHHIYVWDREKGVLVRILEGPKEGLLHAVWHPARPIIASISTYGIVYIWVRRCVPRALSVGTRT